MACPAGFGGIPGIPDKQYGILKKAFHYSVDAKLCFVIIEEGKLFFFWERSVMGSTWVSKTHSEGSTPSGPVLCATAGIKESLSPCTLL